MADIKISELSETTNLEGLYTIGTDRNNVSKKVSLEFVKDAANYANEQGDYAKAAGDSVNGNAGVTDYPVFSTSATYSAGDVVRYNGVLYEFTGYHSGSWNGNDVVVTSINSQAQKKIAEQGAEINVKITELESELIEYIGDFGILPMPADLNSILTRGATAMYNQVADNGYANSPLKVGDRGILVVYANSKIPAFEESSIVYQTIISLSGYLYTRSYTLGVFTDWIEHKPSNALLQEINVALSEFDKSIDNLNDNVGIEDYPIFDVSASYAIGDVVKYNGLLYEFIEVHPAGAWVGTDVFKTSVKEQTNNKIVALEDALQYYATIEQYHSIAKGAVFPETYVVDIDLENLKLKTGRFGFIVSGDTEYHRISDGETSFNKISAGIAFIFFDKSDKMLHLYAYNETYNKKGLFAGILYFYNGSVVDYWVCWSGIKINGTPIGRILNEYGVNGKSAISQKFFTEEINKISAKIPANLLEGKKLSIMGDSISTFSGYIPSGNATYYPNGDITDVNQTWWKKLLAKTGMVLEVNNSWSGARMTNGRGETSMFNAEARYANLGNPDIIMVFGGTNDFWQGSDHAKLGEYNLSVTAEKDLQYFKQAYQNLIEKLQTTYANAEIYILVPLARDLSYFTKNNEGWSLQELWNTCREIGDMYGVNVIDLSKCGINYYNRSQYLVDGLHPKESGMELISDYICKHL